MTPQNLHIVCQRQRFPELCCSRHRRFPFSFFFSFSLAERQLKDRVAFRDEQYLGFLAKGN
jgi:hypothetical protein